MKYWIPGAKGLVGSYLITQLKVPFVATGREVDIADLAQVRAFIKKEGPFTHIINCAAYSMVDPAETEQEAAFRANAIGPEVLGRVAKEEGIVLLHISTDYVFSGDLKRPLTETDPVAPCNYYGYTKLEGERRLAAVNPDATILRTSWVYGAGGRNFVAKLFHTLQSETKLRLVSDQIGRPTYVPDLVEVIFKMLGRPGLYQFANAGPTSKYEFSLVMREEMTRLGWPISCHAIEPCSGAEFPASAKRPLYSAFDTTKIEQLLHIQPRHWRETLRSYVPTPS
jgi:dTDP-4-dehydrorhamnose reductase